MMCEGRLHRGHMRVSQSSVPRVILTGEKRNSYCFPGNGQPSNITTITRKGNQQPRTTGGTQREQEGSGRSATSWGKRRSQR